MTHCVVIIVTRRVMKVKQEFSKVGKCHTKNDMFPSSLDFSMLILYTNDKSNNPSANSRVLIMYKACPMKETGGDTGRKGYFEEVEWLFFATRNNSMNASGN